MLLLPLLLACQDYNLEGKEDDATGTDDSGGVDSLPTGTDGACGGLAADPEAVTPNDACHFEVTGFEPVVNWEVTGKNSLAMPAVGDLDGDGKPEITVVWNAGLLGPGVLAVYHGDGSGMVWDDSSRNYAYGSGPTIADVDEDGVPEIYATEMISDNLFGCGSYKVVALDAEGRDLWETAEYVDCELDHATGIIVSDMDHDGGAEIVAGMVILNEDGSERAIGQYLDSRGCPADGGFVKEGTFPAVADLDLDGEEELITGNTIYDIDGRRIWRDNGIMDGAVSVANLDGDPEGEFVVVYWNRIRAHDTDGTMLWGELEIRTGNILASPAIADLDGDGSVEIVTAGGNELWVLRADGTTLWTAGVTDMSGATGASIFDFDADGVPEVVYIDEVAMYAYNGADGTLKFYSDEHSSVTMYDYPAIADVDSDGHADIVVMNQGGSGMTVFQDQNDSWAPVRDVWNQHGYVITNINDDLTVPVTATPNWTLYNSFHSALALAPGELLAADLAGEILETCELDCDAGWLSVLVRVRNVGSAEIPAGVPVSLYAIVGGSSRYLTTELTPDPIPLGMSSAGISMRVAAEDVASASELYLAVDDDGTGTGTVTECEEGDNEFLFDGPFCGGS